MWYASLNHCEQRRYFILCWPLYIFCSVLVSRDSVQRRVYNASACHELLNWRPNTSQPVWIWNKLLLIRWVVEKASFYTLCATIPSDFIRGSLIGGKWTMLLLLWNTTITNISLCYLIWLFYRQLIDYMAIYVTIQVTHTANVACRCLCFVLE